ncbi:MAG: hypothetical protein WAK91_06965 [Candidatus Acidiferrales bacterium]
MVDRGISTAYPPLFVSGETLMGAVVLGFPVDISKVPIFNRVRII